MNANSLLLLVLTIVDSLLAACLDCDENYAGRMFNAEEANPSDFPFFVALKNGGTTCGGSVIAKHYVITAARCVHGSKCSSMRIFPAYAIANGNSTLRAVRCRPHAKYSRTNLAYDVALIKTRENLLRDGEFRAIPLPASGTVYAPGTKGVVPGVGVTENGTHPEVPLRGVVVVEDWETCATQYEKIPPLCRPGEICQRGRMPKRILCTRGRGSKPPQICDGDSGGPVVIHSVLAGIVLGKIMDGTDCGLVTPSFHTSVAEFLPWIYSIIEPERDTSGYKVIDENL